MTKAKWPDEAIAEAYQARGVPSDRLSREDLELIAAICGLDFDDVDPLRRRIINLRKRGKLPRLTESGHGPGKGHKNGFSDKRNPTASILADADGETGQEAEAPIQADGPTSVGLVDDDRRHSDGSSSDDQVGSSIFLPASDRKTDPTGNEDRAGRVNGFPKARPTEFCGIRFRSKSEAMFAYFLRESARSVYFWYEPDFLPCSTPIDFVRMVDHPERTSLAVQLIEYKPATPSGVYLDELSERFSLCYGQEWGPMVETAVGLVVVGSAYDPSRSGAWRHRFEFDHGRAVPVWDWLDNWQGWAGRPEALEALDYRFDLASPE